MITQVSYARLYNTGNYENIRFEATVTVESGGDTAAAFDEAVGAVHDGYRQWVTDREAEAAERRAELQRQRDAKKDDVPF